MNHRNPKPFKMQEGDKFVSGVAPDGTPISSENETKAMRFDSQEEADAFVANANQNGIELIVVAPCFMCGKNHGDTRDQHGEQVCYDCVPLKMLSGQGRH